MPLSAESEVASLIGEKRVRQPAANETLAARLIVEPADSEEVAELVRKCERDRISLVPIGAARTAALIRRKPARLGISLARLNRVLAYEPDDMTVAVQAGLTLGELNRGLEQSSQALPCDPPGPSLVTLGALIGGAKAGPLRHREGSVRDLLIGVNFVGHGGRAIHAGGHVVKNVAGYDLMKVMTGSFGTLGIITEAIFKVRPILSDYRLALADFTSLHAAFEAAALLNDALALEHLEVLSPGLAQRMDHADRYLVAAGFAGNAPELEEQQLRIRNLTGTATEFLENSRARARYETLRDLASVGVCALAANLAVLPAELARCLEGAGGEFRAHAGCGIAQLFATATDADDARRILARWRAEARAGTGHLRVLEADAAWRAGLEIFDEPNEGALKLMRRLKAAFDPAGIFNPGAFVGGI